LGKTQRAQLTASMSGTLRFAQPTLVAGANPGVKR
jgi:hypothetical protein